MKKVMTMILVFAVMAGGCATSGERSAGDRIESGVRAAATIGTYEALTERPDWAVAFDTARQELIEIAAADRIDFYLVYGIVNRLPVNELKSDRAVVYITAATLLLEEAGRPSVDLDGVEVLRPAVMGLITGIEQGMMLAGVREE